MSKVIGNNSEVSDSIPHTVSNILTVFNGSKSLQVHHLLTITTAHNVDLVIQSIPEWFKPVLLEYMKEYDPNGISINSTPAAETGSAIIHKWLQNNQW